MAQCAYCKTETFLYDGGVPICLECADARDANSKPPETEHRIRTILMRDLLQATARAKAAAKPTASLFGIIPALENTEVLMFRQELGLSLAILIVGIPAWGAVDTSALWRPLDDIASRDVFYGPGGKFDQPRGSFTFIEE